ncbi:MAG: general secretion pathway protein GspB [Pseudomonadota bacterium]
MSFILDALRKSENERQQQGPAEFAGVPTSERETSTPRWLWLVGLLLAINLAVLAGLFMRPDASPPAQPVPTPIQQQRPSAEPSFSDRVAAAQRELPEQVASEPVATPEPERAALQPVVVTQDATSIDTSQIYPTLQEVVAAGRVSLPPLHLDIHVFSDTPADRFVFINMSKYREGARITEGPLVNEITPEGAVLDHQGETFLLPRE